MALKVLYHGTEITSAKQICNAQKADVNVGHTSVDFGPGFYTTDDFERAKHWAMRKARLQMSKPAIVTMYFDEEAALKDELIEFFEDDLRWGRFIINNRNGLKYIEKISFKEHNLDGRYSITYGRIADIDIIEVAESLKQSGKMLNNLNDILNEKYPKQYVFHTDEAVSYIKKYTYTTL